MQKTDGFVCVLAEVHMLVGECATAGIVRDLYHVVSVSAASNLSRSGTLMLRRFQESESFVHVVAEM